LELITQYNYNTR